MKAKPYPSDRICRHGALVAHRQPWKHPEAPLWWGRYIGLGVGERVYKHAATMAPGRRWPARSVSPTGRFLRNKLHQQDPYLWQTKTCELCAAAGITDWRTATPGQFPPH